MNDVIAHLGTPGTFTHEALVAAFGADAETMECPTIPAVFEAVERGLCRYGVVPVENSTEGGVTFTLDSLLETQLQVSRELVLTVEQCLITRARSLADIRRVRSHPQALAQCRRWLAANLPTAAQEVAASTTAGVEVARGDPEVAAIGSALAAQIQGVPILERGIHDVRHNATRFIALGATDAAPTGDDKTSIAFSTKDERGALCAALRVFDEKRLWEYLFFTDIEGHRADPNVSAALTLLKESGAEVRIFGSYPRYRPPSPLSSR
jgi:chorismate mutase / prephenate dehydratase